MIFSERNETNIHRILTKICNLVLSDLAARYYGSLYRYNRAEAKTAWLPC